MAASSVFCACEGGPLTAMISASATVCHDASFIVTTRPADDPHEAKSSKNSKLAADRREPVERELQFVARVGCRHDGTHPRLVARHRRTPEALRDTAFLEQSIGQLHRQRSVADDDRRDRALADA